MNTEQTAVKAAESRKSQTELQNRYGRIRLSAVAAALSCNKKAAKSEKTKAEARA